jgi:hypothetical protein
MAVEWPLSFHNLMHKSKRNEYDLFGPAASCKDFADLLVLQGRVCGTEAAQAVVAYGMMLAARSAPQGEYFKDAVEVLNRLGSAKMELDKAVCHSQPTVQVTAAILSEAQKFLDEMTIPCTEWPTSEEVVSKVSQIASLYSFSGPWKRTMLNSQGQVIGTEEIRGSILA